MPHAAARVLMRATSPSLHNRMVTSLPHRAQAPRYGVIPQLFADAKGFTAHDKAAEITVRLPRRSGRDAGHPKLVWKPKLLLSRLVALAGPFDARSKTDTVMGKKEIQKRARCYR
jgi:hypothetical protein